MFIMFGDLNDTVCLLIKYLSQLMKYIFRN